VYQQHAAALDTEGLELPSHPRPRDCCFRVHSRRIAKANTIVRVTPATIPAVARLTFEWFIFPPLVDSRRDVCESRGIRADSGVILRLAGTFSASGTGGKALGYQKIGRYCSG
jgi:hypothetical protein